MSMKEKSSGIEQRQFWQMVIETRQESGLSLAAFCKKEGISEAAYYYWRRKLAGGMPKSKEKSSPEFLEVVLPGSNAMALELVLSSGNTLRINPGADNKILSQVLSALRQAGLC
jgi:transposase-like protein